jgi:hypothetical protein
MIRRYMLASVFLLPSHAAAESVEQDPTFNKLRGCIESAEYITSFAMLWKATMEGMGETASPSDISQMLSRVWLGGTPIYILDLRTMLAEELPHNEISENLEASIDAVSNATMNFEEAVTALIEEVFNERVNYRSKSEYIANCATGAFILE